MKFTSTVGVLALTATTVLALPTEKRTDDVTYAAPPGGWESIHYPDGTGENLEHYPAPKGGWESVDYPEGTGANLEHYPAPPGGWESVNYPDGTGQNPPAYPPSYAPSGFKFTSTYHVLATPDQVVNGTTPTGGLSGASATFDLALNSDANVICYTITLNNFRGEYQSPAKTATHLHQAARGASGPPRIAFPNPVGTGDVRKSVGCLTGPFTTGVLAEGVDTGTGFEVRQIEENPSAFMVDIHSSLAVPGAVRGQLP